MYKFSAKWPEGFKTISYQESIWNHSKSAHCAHTLHTCSSRKRFSKSNAEEQILSRELVQSIQFSGHSFDFRYGFAIGFESTIKPQPEANNSQWELTIRTLSLFLYAFPKSAREKCIIVQTFGPESAKSRSIR